MSFTPKPPSENRIKAFSNAINSKTDVLQRIRLEIQEVAIGAQSAQEALIAIQNIIEEENM